MVLARISVAKCLTVPLVALLLAGCAARPHKIKAEYVSEMRYANASCSELATEQRKLVDALSIASRSQRAARNWDIVAVVVLGIPVSSLSGINRASEISRLKGELTAVEAVGRYKDCALPTHPDPTVKRRRNEFDQEWQSPMIDDDEAAQIPSTE